MILTSILVIQGSIADSSHRAALQVLCDLCEFRTGPNCSVRPFCNLIIEQKNWIVEPLTEAVGREFAKLTFLGPFLCTSLFAEDDPSVCQLANGPGGLIVSSLQQEMALTRNLLHQVYYCTL